MATEEQKEDMMTILRDIQANIKEIQANIVRKDELYPIVERIDVRADAMDARILVVENASQQQNQMLTDVANNVTKWHSEFRNQFIEMEVFHVGNVKRQVHELRDKIDTMQIDDIVNRNVEEALENHITEEKIMKTIENSQVMMAEYVNERFEGLESYIRENPNVTVQRGGHDVGNQWNAATAGFPNQNHLPTHNSSKDHEERREKAQRRESIFGSRDVITPVKNEFQNGPYWPNTVTTIQLVTRSNFPDVELKTLSSIEHICYFLEQYQNTVGQHQNHQLRMIQFCNKATYTDLTVAAKRLRFISTNIFTGGLMMLTDKQLQDCIYEHVKAKSPEDYIQKIKRVRFRIQGKEEGFHPDASNIPELLNAATYFTHIFRRTTELITETCDPDFIPPMYKEGKTMGLIDYYLAAWPNDSGNILYSRLSVVTPALRVAKNLQQFTDLFLDKIEPYTRLKQQYDDVNAMLKRKADRPEKNPIANKNSSAQREHFKTFDKGKPRNMFRREQVNMMDDEHNLDDYIEGVEETIAQMSQHELENDDDEEQEIVFEHPEDHDQDDQDEEPEELKAPRGLVKLSHVGGSL